MFFYLFFILTFSFAQQPAYFILGEKEFQGVQIYDVIQDNELNYWFATDQGFFKYDNYSFEQVTCAEMKGTSAFGFVKKSDGIIFCYNLNRQILKIENGVCTVFYELKEDEFSNDISLSITKENELLVSTKTAFVLDSKGKRKKTSFPHYTYYGFPFLLSDGRTIIHIANNDSLLIYNNNDFSYLKFRNHGQKINGVLKFFESNGSIFGVSTGNKQFYIYKPEKNELIPFIKFEELNEKEFFRFYEVDGSLWAAGTLSGVYEFRQSRDNFIINGKYYNDYLISDVFKDNEGNLLLSTFNFGVLVIPSLVIPDVLPFNGIENEVSIEFDDELGTLIGTLKGELWSIQENDTVILNESGSLPVQSVFSFEEFPFIIFDDGKLKAIHRKSGKTTILVSTSLKDAVLNSDGNVYVSLNKGIGKISVNNGTPVYERLPGIDLRTYAIDKDDKSNLFFASSEGLKMMNLKGKVSDILFNHQSIFVNDIFSYGKVTFAASKQSGILVIENGEVIENIIPKWNDKSIEILKMARYNSWFYLLTSKGFYVVNHDGQIVSQLNKLHGFSTQRIFDFQIHPIKDRSDLDEIWLVHSNGIHRMRINLLFVDIEKPTIRLNSFFINNSKVDTEKINSFDYNSRDFRFVFSSPTLKNKENVRYHFMLDGYDRNWQISNYFENEISYNALAPGDYTFLVKAENQGKFSETISYSFTISAPVYLRWWFIAGFSLVILIVISLIYRNKLITQRKKAKQLNELNASKLTAIQSQMNPHFIFNSLNSIQDLVLKGDIDNSYTFITKFSDLVRRTLSYSEKDFIDFEQEIKLLELYLTLEKLRFKEDLEYSIDINEVEDIMIPPMLIQPFIENALLHGLLHKEGLKKLQITFRLEELLICEITDNGVGRKKSEEIKNRQRADHESFASNAIKKRFEILSEHYQNTLGFEYLDLEENGISIGTKVTLFIPIKRKF